MGISHADAKVGVPMRQQPNAAWAGMPAGSAGGRQTQAAEISHTLQRRRAAQHFIQTLRDTRATFRAEATGELARELELPEHRPQAREVVGMPTTVPTTDPQLCEAIQAVIADEHPPTTGVLRKPSTIARPSWTVVIALLAAVAAVMWAIMFQRLPDFDPREAIAEKLYAARRAFDTGQYLDPPERSAYHHYNAVLALEPTNVQARNGVERIANHFIEDADRQMVAGSFAAAVLALESVRRVEPNHERLPLLETQLRNALREQLRQAHESSADAPALPAGQILPTAVMPAVEIATAPQPSRQGSHDPRITQSITTGSEAAQSDLRGSRTRDLLEADETIAPQPILERTAENHPIEPAQDNAQHYVDELAQADAQFPATPAEVAPAAGPRLIKFVEPEYPSEAHLRGIEGWVDVSLAVTASGDVTDPRIENSSMSHLFGRAALAAVKQWKYTPLAVSSDAAGRVRVRVQFQLKN